MKRALLVSAGVLVGFGVLLATITTGVDPATQAILQTAVNNYAAIGLHATCAQYVSTNLGGIVTNNVCQVQGSTSWHDAGLVSEMTGPQLQAGIDVEHAGGTASFGLPELFGAGAPADTVQVGASVSAANGPATVLPPPGAAASQADTAASIDSAISSGVTIGSIISSIFTHGGATEVTQVLNNVALAHQLAQQISMLKNAVKQAQYIGSASTYRRIWQNWRNAVGADTYGRNGGFFGNVNGQLGAIQGSLRTLPNLAAVMGKLNGATQDRIGWQYAQAELHDGIAQYALDTAGDIRANDQSANLAQLDGLVFSDDASLNTATQEAHKSAMGISITAHQNEDLKRLLAVIAAQKEVELKAQRDALEQSISGHYEWLARAQKGEPQTYLGDPSARIGNFSY